MWRPSAQKPIPVRPVCGTGVRGVANRLFDRRVDKNDGVKGNEEANTTAEENCTREDTIAPHCREGCKMRDAKYYTVHSNELSELKRQRPGSTDTGRPSISSLARGSQVLAEPTIAGTPLSSPLAETKEDELHKLMHNEHEQWAVTYSPPAGGRWVGGDSVTTYHTLAAEGDEKCTYWVEERITYRQKGSGNTGPGVVPPSLWEKMLREMVVAVKQTAEKARKEQVRAAKSETARGKEREVA
ncbi:hypothetical protein BDW22DRAFT_638506 [Trametopsis cervina]|nr:hypothetical protein BDW22DRAFT_638506 [Trametopsis cervina]